MTTDATLVNVSGRPIPSLKATVAYADNRFRFEATANETGRTITATGDLALLEGGREVTISRAALTAGPATWALADDGPVRVRYQNGLITLPQPVTLVNNGQELSAEGTLAMTDDVTGSLDVIISGVNLTELGALFLVNRQLAGTLTRRRAHHRQLVHAQHRRQHQAARRHRRRLRVPVARHAGQLPQRTGTGGRDPDPVAQLEAGGDRRAFRSRSRAACSASSR